MEQFLSFSGAPSDEQRVNPLHQDLEDWSSVEMFVEEAERAIDVKPSDEFVSLLSYRISSMKCALEKVMRANSLSPSKINTSALSQLGQSEHQRAKLETEVARLKASVQDLGCELFQTRKQYMDAQRKLSAIKSSQQVDILPSGSMSSTPSHIHLPSLGTVPASASGGSDPAAISAELRPLALTEADLSDKAASSVVVAPAATPAGDNSEALRSQIQTSEARVVVLQNQLAEAESARTAAEKALNDHLANPAEKEESAAGSSTEMLRLMNELKEKCAERIAALAFEVRNRDWFLCFD